jgi:transcription termination factor Rho
MYEISELKSKKLPDLQGIAKSIGVTRITGLKKMDLIYQILDHISSNPESIKNTSPNPINPPEENGTEVKPKIKKTVTLVDKINLEQTNQAEENKKQDPAIEKK